MSISQEVRKQQILLTRKIEQVNKILSCSPEGYLVCRKQYQKYRYSFKSADVDSSEKYLTPDDPLLLDLAKRDYYKQYLKDLQTELKAINGYLERHSENAHTQMYLEKRPGIRALLQPALADRKNRYAAWASAPYERSRKYPERLIYITDGGFYVRSKAEQMIANMYLEEGIPFRYEDPVTLPDGRILYPDFHLFSLLNDAEWYHEHNGQMRNDNYYNRYEQKLRMLRSAGIIPGVNLLQTFEAEGYPLHPGCIRDLIHRFLK